MEENQNSLFSTLLPSIAARMRALLANVHLSTMALAPAEARDQDPVLDSRAAYLDQSYYQLLQMALELQTAGQLMGSDPLPVKEGDLAALLRQLCQEASGPAELLHLRFKFVCPMQMCICAYHQTAIENTVYQLLSNAFKFTPSGGSVTVELKKLDRKILLSVRDTGCGIDAAHLETLFERYRTVTGLEPAPHGLGLGLAICRWAAEGMGGTVLVKSEPGVGSEFILSLPERHMNSSQLSDVPLNYNGGFDPTLLALADTLPAKAFMQRHEE